jgi:hypothetical protein
MPYILRDVAHHDGVDYKRGDIVSDAIGQQLSNVGHHGVVTRFAHDDELCAAGKLDCDHLAKAEDVDVAGAAAATAQRATKGASDLQAAASASAGADASTK